MSVQAERQRRWYVNLTPEQREARRAYQREHAHERNARRILGGGNYFGMAETAEHAQEIRVLIELRYAERRAEQAEKREEFEEQLDAEAERHLARGGLTDVLLQFDGLVSSVVTRP